MDDAAPLAFLRTLTDEPAIDRAIVSASAALLKRQKPDGHWVFELEADATIPAEYVLLVHYLGETPDLELERKIGVYLRRIQGDHGGWPLYHAGKLDVSATVKAYFALKMIGDDIDAPHMSARARGPAGSRRRRRLQRLHPIPTRHVWRDRLARRAADTRRDHAPAALVPGAHLEDLLLGAHGGRAAAGAADAEDPRPQSRAASASTSCSSATPPSLRGLPKGAHQKQPWTFLFGVLDRALVAFEPFWPKGPRRRAIAKAEAFVTETAQRRGRPGRDLPGHGQLGDDVRRPRLSARAPACAPRRAVRSTSSS